MAHSTGLIEGRGALGCRRFLAYLVAAPTLAIAARWGLDELSPAEANALPPLPGPTPSDFYDLGDALKAAADKIENVCRCGTYFRIREAIKQAARG